AKPAEASQRITRQRADDQGQCGGGRGDAKRQQRGVDQGLVVEQRDVPARGEAGPHGHQARGVEAKHDKEGDRRIEECIAGDQNGDERVWDAASVIANPLTAIGRRRAPDHSGHEPAPVAGGCVPRSAIASGARLPPRVKWRAPACHSSHPANGVTNSNTSSTQASAAAVGQSRLVKNSFHSTRPTNCACGPPNSSGMTYSPTAGTNTSNAPAQTPGSDRGNVTDRNDRQGGAPRSSAASSNVGSSRVSRA